MYSKKIKTTTGKHFFMGMLFFIAVFASFCKKKEAVDPQLSVSSSEVSFIPEGGSSALTVTCNGKWTLNNPAGSWLKVSPTSGDGGSSTLQLTALANTNGTSRSATLVLSSDGLIQRVAVSQVSSLYPSYNTSPQAPDATGMGSTAVQLAAKFRLGVNVGNTMEAPSETAWGNVPVTDAYVKFLKQTGFTAVRIPCAWNWTHLSDAQKAKIDPAWLNHVKDVVQYCVNNDMYVLLNIHWDGGWLEGNVNKLKKDSVNARQKALWEQIATTMRDFDEHLMFASANEPPAENAEQMEILNSYHQTFINAVRATGGRNSYRVLVVQGPGTDMDKTNTLFNTLPKDELSNRLMVEVHHYTPSQFTILGEDASWGKMFFYWGTGYHSSIDLSRNATWGEESEILRLFGLMKTKFVDKGIPVIMGEYAAFKRTKANVVPSDWAKHEASVNYWNGYSTQQAIKYGLKPFFWEQGSVIDRKNNKVLDQGIMDALINGAK